MRHHGSTQRLRSILRSSRNKTNVNYRTLASNSTRLGWGIIEVRAGIKDSVHSARSGGPFPSRNHVVQRFLRMWRNTEYSVLSIAGHLARRIVFTLTCRGQSPTFLKSRQTLTSPN